MNQIPATCSDSMGDSIDTYRGDPSVTAYLVTKCVARLCVVTCVLVSDVCELNVSNTLGNAKTPVPPTVSTSQLWIV